MQPTHVYEVRPRPDKRGFDLISDALPFGRLWYGESDAGQFSNPTVRLHDSESIECNFDVILR